MLLWSCFSFRLWWYRLWFEALTPICLPLFDYEYRGETHNEPRDLICKFQHGSSASTTQSRFLLPAGASRWITQNLPMSILIDSGFAWRNATIFTKWPHPVLRRSIKFITNKLNLLGTLFRCAAYLQRIITEKTICFKFKPKFALHSCFSQPTFFQMTSQYSVYWPMNKIKLLHIALHEMQ